MAQIYITASNLESLLFVSQLSKTEYRVINGAWTFQKESDGTFSYHPPTETTRRQLHIRLLIDNVPYTSDYNKAIEEIKRYLEKHILSVETILDYNIIT